MRLVVLTTVAVGCFVLSAVQALVDLSTVTTGGARSVSASFRWPYNGYSNKLTGRAILVPPRRPPPPFQDNVEIAPTSASFERTRSRYHIPSRTQTLRDSFPMLRDKQYSIAAAAPRVMQTFQQQRHFLSVALVVAAVVSVALIVPFRSVHAMADGLHVPTLIRENVSVGIESMCQSQPMVGQLAARATTTTAVGNSALYISPISMGIQLRLTGRMVYAAILGALVGKERSSGSQEQRFSSAGGIRTMALVAMGAATFTLCSMYGFGGVGASRYDPSRMAANVSSGVGFLGAGVITTSAQQHQNQHLSPIPGQSGSFACGGSMVHGLTTAAAIWLSAAVGVGCGVGMCVVSTAAALLTIVVMRIGENQQLQQQQTVQEAKRKLSEQHIASQRSHEEQQLFREWRRAEDLRHRSHTNHTPFPPSTSFPTFSLYKENEDNNNESMESIVSP